METMSLLITCTVTWGHGDNLVPDVAEDYVWVHYPTVPGVLIHVGTRGQTDSRGGGGTTCDDVDV